MADYTARLTQNRLDIQFTDTIAQKYRNQLKDLGFTYNRTLKSWCGTQNHREAIRVARTACSTTAQREYKETLCWRCRNSVLASCSPCSWAREFLPVDGWKAEPIYGKKSVYRLPDESPNSPVSYQVEECPMFISD